MRQVILAAFASALAGLAISALALWILAGAQLRIEFLERRILGVRVHTTEQPKDKHVATMRPTRVGCLLLAWPAWLAGALAGGPLIGSLSAAATWFGYVSYAGVSARRRQHALIVSVRSFTRDLHLLASSGDTADRCLRLATERCPGPMHGLLRTALLGAKAGQSLHGALSGIADLALIPEWRGLLHALWLHLETGASLSSLLADGADRADEAELLRSEADSKLSEARSTAKILAVVPIAVAAYLMVFNRGAITPLFKDPTGRLALVFGAFLWLAGVLVVWRMQMQPSEFGGET